MKEKESVKNFQFRIFDLLTSLAIIVSLVFVFLDYHGRPYLLMLILCLGGIENAYLGIRLFRAERRIAGGLLVIVAAGLLTIGLMLMSELTGSVM